jgi:hypothetical protein
VSHEKRIVECSGPHDPHALDGIPVQPRSGDFDAECPLCQARGMWNREYDLASQRSKRALCDKCDGRGAVHDCPDCECECTECEGGTCHQPVMVAWRGAHISRGMWLLISALPGSMIASRPPLPPIYDHVSFAFDGGVGIVMPMRTPTIPEDVEPLIVAAEALAQSAA